MKLILISVAAYAATVAIAGAEAASKSAPYKSTIVEGDPLPRRDNRPLEVIPGVETQYTSVLTRDGVRLRALISRPRGETQKLKPIVFTQWVSCGSVEFNPESGARNILATLARDTGLALIRVDRAGAGDSDGPDCGALDYDTEVEHYVDAYKALLGHEWIDDDGVFVYGSSLGSTTAPLVAAALQADGVNIAGVAVQGGGALTHFERMVRFDRIYLERRPAEIDSATIHQDLLERILFQTEYLIKGRHPDDIAGDNAAMARVRVETRGLNETDHYGRPFAWHQQAAKRNFLKAWLQIEAPVLVIFNEFEQFETEHGHALIVDMVNRSRPGTATLVIAKGLGHSNMRYDNRLDAYAAENGAPAWETTAKTLVDWFASLGR